MASVHDWLCRRAYHWLLTAGGCRWALREQGESNHGERPDALGWQINQRSILIECKATRADFHSDKKKPFRDPDRWKTGLGQDRYYMAPPGVLTEALLPDGWGFMECHQYKVIVVKEPVKLQPHKEVLFNEVKLLFNLFADLPNALTNNYQHEDYVERINRLLGDETPWEKKSRPKKPQFR